MAPGSLDPSPGFRSWIPLPDSSSRFLSWIPLWIPRLDSFLDSLWIPLLDCSPDSYPGFLSGFLFQIPLLGSSLDSCPGVRSWIPFPDSSSGFLSGFLSGIPLLDSSSGSLLKIPLWVPLQKYLSRRFPPGRIFLICLGSRAGTIQFFLEFYIDPGGPGGHPGGSRTDPRASKPIKYIDFSKFFKNR